MSRRRSIARLVGDESPAPAAVLFAAVIIVLPSLEHETVLHAAARPRKRNGDVVKRIIRASRHSVQLFHYLNGLFRGSCAQIAFHLRCGLVILRTLRIVQSRRYDYVARRLVTPYVAVVDVSVNVLDDYRVYGFEYGDYVQSVFRALSGIVGGDARSVQLASQIVQHETSVRGRGICTREFRILHHAVDHISHETVTGVKSRIDRRGIQKSFHHREIDRSAVIEYRPFVFPGVAEYGRIRVIRFDALAVEQRYRSGNGDLLDVPYLDYHVFGNGRNGYGNGAVCRFRTDIEVTLSRAGSEHFIFGRETPVTVFVRHSGIDQVSDRFYTVSRIWRYRDDRGRPCRHAV